MAAPTIQLKRGSNAVPNALAGEPIIRYNGSITELHIGDSGGTTSELIASDAAYDANTEILTKSVASTSVASLTLKDSQAAQGTLTVQPNASTTDYTFVFPAAAGDADDVLTVTSVAAGVVTMDFAAPSASSFTLAADAGTSDTFNTGETLTFTGGTGISSTVSNNQISYGLDAQLVDIAGLTPTDGGFIVGDGNNFIVESAATARASLGVDAAGTDNSTDVTLVTTTADYLSITGQAITLNQIDLTTDVTGDLPIAEGGTAASTAADARTNLGLAIGSDVQAHGDILDDLSGLTQATDKLPYFDSATTAATTDLSSFGRTLIDDADAATARTTLGVDAAGTDNSTDVTLVTTTADYLSIAGQAITLGQIDLATDVTGSLPNGNLANSTITVSDGSNSTATALGGTITFSGTANEVEVTESSGTITVGLPDDVTVTGDLAVNGADITTTSTGTATVFNTNAATLNIGGAATAVSIGNSGGTVTIPGNLTVSGTTTTVNSTTVTIADLNITLASGAADATEADGAGLTIDGANATWTFEDNFVEGGTEDAWVTSEHLAIAADKNLYMDGGAIIVLDDTTATTTGYVSMLNTIIDAGTYT